MSRIRLSKTADLFFIDMSIAYKVRFNKKTNKYEDNYYQRVKQRLKKIKLKDKFNIRIFDRPECYESFEDFEYVRLTKEQRNQDFLFEYMSFIKSELRLLRLEIEQIHKCIAYIDTYKDEIYELKPSATYKNKVFKFSDEYYDECPEKDKFNRRLNPLFYETEDLPDKKRKELIDKIDCD